MRTQEICHAWVVYLMRAHGGKALGNVVCEQREWDALESAHPGQHLLLHTGLGTEKDAEQLARGTSGDNYVNRGSRRTPALKRLT